MYNLTYEELLQRTLDRVVKVVDKTEGSFIYDALAPTVAELHQCYLYINELENKVFVDTATGEYLERRCAERGIKRKTSTPATRIITFNNEVPIGSRWGKEDLIYTVQYRAEMHQTDSNKYHYGAVCNQAGAIGNRYSGEMINIDSIMNQTGANLNQIVIAGTDEETDEELRERYFNSFKDDSFGGNIQDYKNKIGALEGVGSVKVYPCWKGAGTVKVLVLGNDGVIPNQSLIESIQTQVDPTVNAGQGLGLAPVGHVVTVAPAESLKVNVAFNLTFKEGYNWETLQDTIKNTIGEYLKGLSKEWSNVDNITVRLAHIESRILNVVGVEDVTNTTINGESQNLILQDSQVAILGDVLNG